MAARSLPPIALTAGEPAGIGPDLCLAAALKARDYPLVCLADREQLGQRAHRLGLDVRLHDYSPTGPITTAPGELCVWHHPLAHVSEPGTLDPANAPQVLELIRNATRGCLSGQFSAMVTAPVQKSLINDAGIPFSGHTEFIAELTHSALPVMMLVAGSLRVALATTHLPLRAVADAIRPELISRLLTILDHDLTPWLGRRPHIVVCGLNPHAGEGGHLGSEERTQIEPAVASARAAGLDVRGPLPADTVFVPRHLAGVDVVLAMYHDQGLPVLKHAGFGHAVNVTLGLPIVRTSVDHGTALDLAGSGRADEGSLSAALALAVQLARTASLKL